MESGAIYFWISTQKNTKIQKIYIIKYSKEIQKKIIRAKKGCWNAHKITRNWLTRKIQFEKKKFKIKCLWTQLNFIGDLIEFMKGLIARKNIFKSI